MTIEEVPVKNLSKMSFGPVQLDAKVSLFDSDVGIAYGDSVYPKTFEALQQYTGFMLYETTLPANSGGKGLLVASGLHDRAIIYIDKVRNVRRKFMSHSRAYYILRIFFATLITHLILVLQNQEKYYEI